MRRLLLHLTMLIGLSLSTLMLPGFEIVAAAACPSANTPQGQALQGINESGTTGCNDSGVNNVITTAVQILSMVIGAAAVIMIMVGGFKYITSGGDSNKVANAKGTLLFAIIGIVVAALAQLIVHYVLNQANSAGT